MMPIPPVIKTRRLLALLEKLGFAKVSQKGSHLKLKRAGTSERSVIVPMHEEIPRGTLFSILRQAGIEKERFEKLLEES